MREQLAMMMTGRETMALRFEPEAIERLARER
jgi:hypothetical protein